MVKKCIYCSTEIDSNFVVDICKRCMYQVWGEKMAKAIVDGMERERDVGNLDLGQVTKNDIDVSKPEVEVVVSDEEIVCENAPEYSDMLSEQESVESIEVQNDSPEELTFDNILSREN